MKNIFLFSTKLRVYLTEIPFILILLISIKFNSKVNTLTKLYPLIIISVIGILFVMIYFFRGIKINIDEIRTVGLFGAHDHALVKDRSRLVITVKPKRKLKVELFEKCGNIITYSWQKNDFPDEINIFRGTAVGSHKSLAKVMRGFGFSDDDIASAIERESFSSENELAILTSFISDDLKKYCIQFKIPEPTDNGDITDSKDF